MLIDFLEAANGAALCKTHEADANGTITTHPYPLVKRFTSHREDVQDINDLYQQLQNHASLGHCALKGILTDELNSEERRGKTSPTQATTWLCLDLDFDSGFSGIDDFVKCLGASFQDCSYIFQHSNSAGIKGKAGLRGHLYFALATPSSPGALKEWLKEINFSTPALESQLVLAKNGHSLIWPLDISTCQNDKLIYISPPTLVNLSAPVGQYFVLHQKGQSTSAFIPNPNPSKNKADVLTKVAALRAQMGLKVSNAKYKNYGTEQILTNPDPMIIAESRDDGEYIRVNVVGDNPSWGYYYDKNQPDILRNFKGHPLVKLQDIDPGYFQGISQARRSAQAQRTSVPLIFRDFETDEYFNGIYDAPTETVDIRRAGSKDKLSDFLENHDIPMPESVPDWTYRFDPTTLKVVDFNDQWANKFTPTRYLREASTSPTASVPASIDLILRSITVDQQTYSHLINWLAYIFQTREKSQTAWLFSGIEGTGKGLLVSRILAPLFGDRYVVQITGQNLEEIFNAQFEECIFLFVDEFNVKDGYQVEKLHNKIKNIITEKRIAIRRMRTNAYETDSFLNLIMATNAGTAIPLSPEDRRFNIAPPQNKRLEITPQQVDDIENELPQFAEFLQSYQADETLARTTLKNQARLDLINKSFTSIDLFFRAVEMGEIEYFLDFIDNSTNTAFGLDSEEYKTIVRAWSENGIKFIPREELQKAYNYLQNSKISASKFSRLCTYHNLEQTSGRVDGTKVRGYKTSFKKIKIDDYFKSQAGASNVTKIK